MNDNGFDVKHYQTDNGIFTKQRFMEGINKNDQTITCYGVNIHQQNAHDEIAIDTVITSSRIMMLHAGIFVIQIMVLIILMWVA